jgi:hypothetical protein
MCVRPRARLAIVPDSVCVTSWRRNNSHVLNHVIVLWLKVCHLKHEDVTIFIYWLNGERRKRRRVKELFHFEIYRSFPPTKYVLFSSKNYGTEKSNNILYCLPSNIIFFHEILERNFIKILCRFTIKSR